MKGTTMKRLLMLGIVLMLTACSGDGHLRPSIQADLNSPRAQAVLNPAIRLDFSQAQYRGRNLGTYVANKKTNSYNKRGPQACQIAFLSAVRSLQGRAAALGGNAVVNIHSFYKKNATYSPTTYDCDDGLLMAGVALRGTVIKE